MSQSSVHEVPTHGVCRPTPKPYPIRHEGPILVFDRSLAGFCSWVKKRLIFLGYMVKCLYGVTPDSWLETLAYNGHVIVTTDKPLYRRLRARGLATILLVVPEKKRWYYEEWWTQLGSGIKGLLCEESSFSRASSSLFLK